MPKKEQKLPNYMQMAVETVNIKILKQETLINWKYRHGPRARPRPIFCVV